MLLTYVYVYGLWHIRYTKEKRKTQLDKTIYTHGSKIKKKKRIKLGDGERADTTKEREMGIGVIHKCGSSSSVEESLCGYLLSTIVDEEIGCVAGNRAKLIL